MSNQSSSPINSFSARIGSVAAAAAMLVAASAANAAPVTFIVELDPGNEVPAVNGSSGTGSGLFVLDTVDKNAFSWLIQFSGLTGPAVAAHIHQQPDGTVPGEANGGILIDLNSEPDGALLPLDDNDGDGTLLGSTELSEDFVAGLNGSLWYVNIHTETNPGGEIRGQILVGDVVAAVPLPAAAWLMISGVGLLGVGFRRKRK